MVIIQLFFVHNYGGVYAETRRMAWQSSWCIFDFYVLIISASVQRYLINFLVFGPVKIMVTGILKIQIEFVF
ncbi:hypothetical protein DF947_01695 [Pedobacter paludis]|uniref:Uncharacterized protein n=1 Tax=Pedobacter paludis TaxID=2203212 RepID=A0A317F3F3_9SPHI|nr:hypothetical protein DF947_01695 [Pedobacter paludis]